MVNNRDEQLNLVFSALSDATRRAMLQRLADQEMTVNELAEPFHMSKPAISKHVKVLENAGLLQRQIDGRVHRCRISAKPLNDAADWLAFYQQFWSSSFDALEAHLQKSKKEKT